jgi:D-lyxose ketol-isomerase
MKRSEINAAIEQSILSAENNNVNLPIWVSWSPDRFGPEADGLRQQRLGWKVIDFGQGRFNDCGLVLLVVSSPLVDEAGNPLTVPSVIADCIYPVAGFSRKLLFVKKGQCEPHHFHRMKTRKDVTVLAGDTVRFELSWATPEVTLSDREVSVQVDGIWHRVAAGGSVCLKPGQTITLPSDLSHIIEPVGAKDVILLETSTANNDCTDNFFPFISPTSKPIDEDEPARYQLLDEYSPFEIAVTE